MMIPNLIKALIIQTNHYKLCLILLKLKDIFIPVAIVKRSFIFHTLLHLENTKTNRVILDQS